MRSAFSVACQLALGLCAMLPLIFAGSAIADDGEMKILFFRGLPMVFQDGVESGDTSFWSEALGERPNCNCYFSGDCQSGQFCDWGSQGPFTEEDCNWRLPKPTNGPGSGCDVNHNGGPGPICDGICSPSSVGSSIGYEDPVAVRQALRLWSEALLAPAAAGGAPVDERLATAAKAIEFTSSDATWILGRHAAGVLLLATGERFDDDFCHYENHPDETAMFANLAGDGCRLEAARMAIETLLAELAVAGSGRTFLQQIPAVCPNWQNMFGQRCSAGPGTLDCVQQRLADMAVFLSTPKLPIPVP